MMILMKERPKLLEKLMIFNSKLTRMMILMKVNVEGAGKPVRPRVGADDRNDDDWLREKNHELKDISIGSGYKQSRLRVTKKQLASANRKKWR